MATGDDLVDRAHSGSIASDHSEEVALCRRLVARSRLAHVHAFLEESLMSLGLHRGAEEAPQLFVIRIAEGGEACPHGVVVPTDLHHTQPSTPREGCSQTSQGS